VLTHPDLTAPFELEVDVAGLALEAVLLQHKKDGKKHLIVYYLSINKVECKHDIWHLE
jgi:hypothetical protein